MKSSLPGEGVEGSSGGESQETLPSRGADGAAWMQRFCIRVPDPWGPETDWDRVECNGKSQATQGRPQPPASLPGCMTLGKLRPAQFLHLSNGGDSRGYLTG